MKSLIEGFLPDPISGENMRIYLNVKTRIGTPAVRNI
jgi:hypothetical protein